jgi:hypothetical protein
VIAATHRLPPQPDRFEGISAMADVLQLAHPSTSDRDDLEEVDDERDAALPPSATLANQGHDATIWSLDELQRLR